MIKLIIFDLSGVCYTDEETLYLRKLSRKYEIEFNELIKTYGEFIEKAERDEISGIKAWSEICKKYNLPKNPEEIPLEMMKLKNEVPEVLSIVKKLREKYSVAFLTNLCREHWEEQSKIFNVESRFDFGVVSYQIKARKPNEKGYKFIMEHFKVKPEQTIFIDDSKKNTEGASKIGINAVHFQDISQLKTFFKTKGVFI